MKKEDLSKRELKAPESAPSTLSLVLEEAQNGIGSASSIDALRWIHDGLALLAEVMTSFSVGALKSVGPHSSEIDGLLAASPSLTRTEKLLAQAFVDWKDHPHHPTYESLQEIFFLTSRIQSSRAAPRRHTRWLGVEGRAVSGLESLSQWSQAIDQIVASSDEDEAAKHIALYLPVLWIWTDSLEKFFQGWSIQLESRAEDGRLSFSGSASRDGLNLQLLPTERIAGLKSKFVSDGNGGVQLDGFLELVSSPAETSVVPDLVAEVPQDLPPLVEAAPVLPVEPPAPLFSGPEVTVDEPDLPSFEGAADTSGAPSAEVPLFASPDTPAPVAESVPATPLPDFVMPEGISEEAALPIEEPLPTVPDFAMPEIPAPVVPDLQGIATPEPAPAVPELTAPAVPEVSAPAVSDLQGVATPEPAPAVPEVAAPAVPDLQGVATPESAPAVPELTAPAVPEVSAPAVPDLQGVATPEPAPVVPELTAPAVPEVSAPAVPDLQGIATPEPASVVPELTAPAVPEVSALAVPDLQGVATLESAPAVPELTAPAVPEVSAPAVPDLQGIATPEPAPVVPELTAPAVPEVAAPAVPDLQGIATPEPASVVPELTAPAVPEVSAPAVPELTAPAVPEVSAPAVPELTAPAVPEVSAPAVPDLQGIATPEPAPAVPELAAPAVPEVSAPAVPDLQGIATPEPAPAVPELTAPAVPEVSAPAVPDLQGIATPEPAPAVPELTAPAVPEVSAPAVSDLQGIATPEPAPAVPEVAAPAVPEVAAPVVPDFSAPTVPEVAAPVVPDFSAPAVPEVAAPGVPDFSAPAVPEVAAPGVPDFSAPAVPKVSTPAVPDLQGIAATEPAPAVPDFSAPVASEDSAPTVPDFSTPAVPEVATPAVPDFSAPATDVPDFSTPAAAGAAAAAAAVVSGLPGQDSPDEVTSQSVDADSAADNIQPDFSTPASPPPLEPADDIASESLLESEYLAATTGKSTPEAPSGMFTFSDDAFTVDSDPSAPLFPTSAPPEPKEPAPVAEVVQTSVSASPFVASQAPVAQSIESASPLSEATELGAGVEEVLEDGYRFCAESGPTKPDWKGWTVEQGERVQSLCSEKLESRGAGIPSAFREPIFGALSAAHSSVQVLLAGGCGKSTLASALRQNQEHGLSSALSLEGSVFSEEFTPGETLLAAYFALRQDAKDEAGITVPEPETAIALVSKLDTIGFNAAFYQLLSQIGVLNKETVTLIFDEPDEEFRQAICEGIPAGIRVISLVTPAQSDPGLGVVVDLQSAWPAAATEVLGPEVAPLLADPSANFLRAAVGFQMKACGAEVPASLADIGPALLKVEKLDQEFLSCLSLEPDPISLDDLDQWFLDAEYVIESLTSIPSLFLLKSSRLAPLVGLSHTSLESLVGENLQELRSSCAARLLGWVVNQIECTNPEKYGGLQVRGMVYRNFRRLYGFAEFADSPEVLEWVVRNKDFQRRRVVLTSHLETSSSRWELHQLHTVLARLLTRLVDSGECDDLRDERAWALSNLALNEKQLGLVSEAQANIVSALSLFEVLVEDEDQHEFRSALATTSYRASLILYKAGDLKAALEYADRAVADFVDLVEDRGRVELQPRLGVALAHRGSLNSALNDLEAAKKDLIRSGSLIGAVADGGEREYLRTQVEVQLELAALETSAGNPEAAVRESGKAVQIANKGIEDFDMDSLQPLLASCHTSRARSFLALDDPERAERDISKSLRLRNLAVDEGRLEERFALATDYLFRAKLSKLANRFDDSIRDFDLAAGLLEQLCGEGVAKAPSQYFRCLHRRAEVLLGQGQTGRAVSDLSEALKLVEKPPVCDDDEAANLKVVVLDSLLKAHLQAGQTTEALAISDSLLRQYQAAQDWGKYARIQIVRGDAFEQEARMEQARDAYNQAVGILSKVLEGGQADEPLGLIAEAYLGLAGVDLKQGNSEIADGQAKRALDIFTHLFQQRKMTSALPRMLLAYTVHATAKVNLDKLIEAKSSLDSAFGVMNYMAENKIPTGPLESQKGELHRMKARILHAQGDALNAHGETEEAIRNFLVTRQQNQNGPWKDEVARTWVLRSQIFFTLKDFSQAESQVVEAIAHFEGLVLAGRAEYFGDLMNALSVKADNASKSGKIDKVLEEYAKMLQVAAAVGAAGGAIDGDRETAAILLKRARVYRDQTLFNEAYGDYEKVIGLYRSSLSKNGSVAVGKQLLCVYIERGDMLKAAGHAEHAATDYTEGVNVAKALVSQGDASLVAELARGLQKRAECYVTLKKPAEAMQDFQGCIGFQMQLAQSSSDPELLGSLGKALLSQGSLFAAYQQVKEASDSLDKAISVLTSLVEQRGLREYSGDLAHGLIQRVGLSPDKTDPALRQTMVKAVRLVTEEAKNGLPVARDFPLESLRAVVELLSKEDYETVGELIDVVLELVEIVVTDGKSDQDFVKLTDLLLAASAGLIDDRRTARRPHSLALACVSCNREIHIFGKNSLPRLVYCLYELGQALERSKPPTVLNYIGGSFGLLGELASQHQTNEDFLRELKMMVSTWRSLPPQVPALANVSRHMLSQLLRLT